MLRKEDFESWNQLFPDCKIYEADLSHPTEAFLTKALISYLKAFGFKEDPSFLVNDGNDKKTKRMFQVILAKQIDYIYKITDKSYSFCTYDLLKPTPKKTSHLLGILLNYLFYYNMYKTNVFEIVTGRLKEQYDLKKSITKEENENKEMASMVEKCKEEIKQLSKELPDIKEALANYTADLAQKKEINHKLNEEIEELKKSCSVLEEEKANLEKEVVSQNEIKTLEAERETLKVDINSLKQQGEQLENIIKDHKNQIACLETLCKGIDEAKCIIPLSILEDLKSASEGIPEAKIQLANEQTRESELLLAIGLLDKDMENLIKEQHFKELELKKSFGDNIYRFEDLKKAINEETKNLEEVYQKLNETEAAVSFQSNVVDFLLDNAKHIMPYFSLEF